MADLKIVSIHYKDVPVLKNIAGVDQEVMEMRKSLVFTGVTRVTSSNGTLGMKRGTSWIYVPIDISVSYIEEADMPKSEARSASFSASQPVLPPKKR